MVLDGLLCLLLGGVGDSRVIIMDGCARRYSCLLLGRHVDPESSDLGTLVLHLAAVEGECCDGPASNDDAPYCG